jgi:hypothetical protein
MCLKKKTEKQALSGRDRVAQRDRDCTFRGIQTAGVAQMALRDNFVWKLYKPADFFMIARLLGARALLILHERLLDQAESFAAACMGGLHA